ARLPARQRARPPPDQHRGHRQPDPRRARAVGGDDGQRRLVAAALTEAAAVPLDRVTFPVGALGCNCTIVSCPETREALVIDPGDEAPEILAALARAGLRAVKIVHTHAHFDHVMGTGEVAAGTGAEVLLHHEDRFLYDNAAMQMAMFRLARGRPGAASAR